jgi:hypothetical protein
VNGRIKKELIPCCRVVPYCVAGGVPDGGVPDGRVPEGAVPFIFPPISPAGGVPEGAVPFICPPGVPEGAVPLICSPDCGVPTGVVLAACPSACCVSVEDVVDDDTALSLDDVVVPEVLVQPAIMIPAMRIADAISMSILLFFIE